MTDDDGRKILAKRIMGWTVSEYSYLDAEHHHVMGVNDWHPETDLMQVMMVAETLRLEHGWEYVITAQAPRRAGWTINKGPFGFCLNWAGRSEEEFRTRQIHYIYEANADALERAIFLAAAQVAEAMEGKE